MTSYYIQLVPYDMASSWVVRLHYAHRIPSILYSYGLFKDGILCGVITYGLPASPFLCRGVCGKDWKDNVLELNRMVIVDGGKNAASMLVGRTLKMLPKPRIVVSYADTKWNHIGYVYQATNWLYTGITKERTDMFSTAGHSRHHDGDPKNRQERSAKHRYIFFVGSKQDVKRMKGDLRYEIKPYPKGESKHYDIEFKIGEVPVQRSFEL